MKTLFIGLRGLAYGFLFVLLWRWMAINIRVYDEVFGVTFPSWIEIPGIFCMMLGGLLAFLCLMTFIVRGKGTPAPFDPPKEFVVVGPYRYVRNPMYIGGWICIIGAGLYLHSISIVILSLIFLFLMHLFVIFLEERWLEKEFGGRYLEYKKTVRRWIPRWRK